MLGWRLGVSAVLIPLLIAVFMFDHRAGETAWPLGILCLLLVWRGSWELTRLLAVRNLRPSFLMVAFTATLVVAGSWCGHAYLTTLWPTGNAALFGLAASGLLFSLGVLLLFTRAALRFHAPGAALETLSAEILCVSYIGLLVAVTVQLRWVAGAELGYLVLASVVLCTKFGDVSAYFSGRFLGKTKLIPRLSPGKTRVGAFGALVGAGLASWLWFKFATPYWGENLVGPPWWQAVGYGVLLGAVGLMGDLCESLIKRDVGAKDSAELLPGFGGLLDLIDSVVFAGPVAFLFWSLWPVVRTATN